MRESAVVCHGAREEGEGEEVMDGAATRKKDKIRHLGVSKRRGRSKLVAAEAAVILQVPQVDSDTKCMDMTCFRIEL